VNAALTVASARRNAARGKYRSTGVRTCLGDEWRDVKYETRRN